MSDALCGPSNPLQQFKQQTQYDRTLQQDRLTSRHTPAQGFRSIDPNAGLLDPEFEAFQAGLPPSELSNLPTVHPQSQSLAGPSQPPSWATDFQRMQISPPPSFQPQQQYTPQPTQAPNNWAQGFRQHVAQTTPRTQHAAPTPQAFQHMARYGGMNGYQSNFAQSSYAQQPVQSKGKQAVTEQFDDAAFEQAFDLARDALMAETQPLQDAGMAEEMAYVNGASTGNMDQEGMQNPAADLAAIAARVRARRFEAEKAAPAADWKMQEELVRQPDRHLPPLSEINIPRQDEQMQDDTKPANDDDALAQTAQELLEKVEHNQTDKFRNSQFLGLMRRLRDREVKVEGDKMVETAGTDTSTTTDAQQLNQFNNTEQTPQYRGPIRINAAPYDYTDQTHRTIPPHEQDHDAHRYIDPRDGQEVVDLLNRPQQVFEEVEAEVDELDESDERGYEGGGNGGPAHDIDEYDPEPAETTSPFAFTNVRPWTTKAPGVGST